MLELNLESILQPEITIQAYKYTQTKHEKLKYPFTLLFSKTERTCVLLTPPFLGAVVDPLTHPPGSAPAQLRISTVFKSVITPPPSILMSDIIVSKQLTILHPLKFVNLYSNHKFDQWDIPDLQRYPLFL